MDLARTSNVNACIACPFVGESRQDLSIHENHCKALRDFFAFYARESQAQQSNDDDDDDDDDDDNVDDVGLQIADNFGQSSNAESSAVPPTTSLPVYPSTSGRSCKLPRRFQDMDSEQQLTDGDRGDALTSALDAQSGDKETNAYAPSTNYGTYLLMKWFGRTKGALTLTDLDDLVKNVLCAPDFNPQELEGFDAIREVELLFRVVKKE